jgi:hypothetical protein
LPSFVAAGEKQDHVLTLSAEIYPISWTEVDTELKDAGADWLDVAELAGAETLQGHRHASAGGRVEAIAPFLERALAGFGAVCAKVHSR